jgi:prolyl 4-hydroxylase
MHSSCAPVCNACGMKSYEEHCPIDPNAKSAWEPGDLDQMFDKLTSEPYKTQYDVTILSSPPDGPWVITMDNVLSPEEARRLIELGHDAGYERSTEVGKVHDDGSVDQDVTKARTSTNAWCIEETCVKDDVTIRVLERLSNFTNIPETNSEYIQLLRYDPGQYYHPHHDYIQHHTERQHGVRILTVYLYLNDVQAGGGTNFDNLDLTVQPKAGRALLWPSTLNESPNDIDERTGHQALPVETGIKYGANMWFHQFDFRTPDANGCVE